MLSLAYLLVSSATLAHSFPIFSLYETCNDHDKSSCPGGGRSILMDRVIWILHFYCMQCTTEKRKTRGQKTRKPNGVYLHEASCCFDHLLRHDLWRDIQTLDRRICPISRGCTYYWDDAFEKAEISCHTSSYYSGSTSTWLITNPFNMSTKSAFLSSSSLWISLLLFSCDHINFLTSMGLDQ